jgi:hypothetical protein
MTRQDFKIVVLIAIAALFVLAGFLVPRPKAVQAQGSQTANRATANLNASSTGCATTNSCATLTVPPDAGGVAVQISGTFSATLQFEVSLDGTNWVAIGGTPAAGGVSVTSATTAGTYQFSIAALVGFRVRCSSFSSGLVQVVVQAGFGSPTVNPQTAVQSIGTTNSVAVAGNPTAVSAGAQVGPAADLTGNVFVRTGGPNQFTCYARGVSNALTDFTQVSGSTGCGATPGAGLRAYITDITAQSTTGTGGTFRLSYGTGSACATTNNALFPASTSDAFNYPPNSAGTNPLQISFNQPLVPAAANRLCVFGTATNTLNISINGFIAP